MVAQLQDFIESGFLTFEAIGKPDYQPFFYHACMQQYRHKHNWLAFIDLDEFIVLRKCASPALRTVAACLRSHRANACAMTGMQLARHTSRRPATLHHPAMHQQVAEHEERELPAPLSRVLHHVGKVHHPLASCGSCACRNGTTLKQYLDGFRDEVALAMHWVMVGPSGQDRRPRRGGALRTYTECDHKPSAYVKSIANSWFLSNVAGNPHVFEYRRAPRSCARTC